MIDELTAKVATFAQQTAIAFLVALFLIMNQMEATTAYWFLGFLFYAIAGIYCAPVIMECGRRDFADLAWLVSQKMLTKEKADAADMPLLPLMLVLFWPIFVLCVWRGWFWFSPVLLLEQERCKQRA